MTDRPFVHLHVHTEFSLLDGLSKISKLVDRAKALDMPALAITDHGTMFGVIDFFRACQDAEIKPIIGVEAYLARRTMYDRDPKEDRRPFHMLLLAKDQTGYQNLLKLVSKAQLEGFYGNPRIDRELLAAHSDGLIATSGCLAAQIPRMVTEGKEDEARETIGWYQDVFGAENFYLELQEHEIDEQRQLTRWLADYRKSNHTQVQLVATSDVHYVLEKDYDAHDTLLCIQTSAVKSETNRMGMSDNSYFLTDGAYMWQRFGEINDGEPLLNTLKIAEMCNVDLNTKGYHLPVFPVPPGYTADSYLRYLCEIGLTWRYGDTALGDERLVDRLNHELNIIHTMGFDTYFLIVWDLCEYARHADIWWNVRGSGAGSLAAYCLGITNIDPIQNSLLFERFLNPGRVSMPDIDLDYPDDQRADMIEYTARKYGEDKVAAIITFGTLGAKAAVRDVGRALGVDLGTVNQAARLIPTEAKQKKLMQYVEDIPDLKQMYNSHPDIQRIIETAKELQGVSRHASTHAAGIIVSDRPLVEYIPLHRMTKGGGDKKKGTDEDASSLKQVTQFPMETCESIGLLKVDFLGLSTLTIMRRACELIDRHHGIKWSMENIPYLPTGHDDLDNMLEETFRLIGRGETIGIFQVESSGMQQTLREMRPTQFQHIIAAISLYRPGPMEFIPQYVARMHGREQVEYRHPKLESILADTYGICVSGDAVVFDADTGQPHQLRDLHDKAGAFYVQGINEDFETRKGLVTRWINSGQKDVFRVRLRNGAEVKTTIDHRFLTEDGWKRLEELSPGDYVATPPTLLEPTEPISLPRKKLRVLAYLSGDGSLRSYAAVDFVSKDQRLIAEYLDCPEAFEDVTTVFIPQVRDVTRVSIKNRNGKGITSLLAWMREIGFKNPPGVRPGGLRSHEKHIPDFIFRLNNDDLAYFLASLWDCDGFFQHNMCHYKTISRQLAKDVQTLLLRLGIPSVIHRSEYASSRGNRQVYQVTIYDTVRLAELLQPHLVSFKAHVERTNHSRTTIDRAAFTAEVEAATTLSKRQLMKDYGTDRQHFVRRDCDRISAHVVENTAHQLDLQHTQRHTNLAWEPVTEIEHVGVEDVYDLTVEGLHNFVADGIIVHNCVYQEQIMQIAGELFGYNLGEADLMRRAVSKKKEKELKKHKAIFLEEGPKRGIDAKSAEKIFDDIEYFANYGFNRSHASDYAVITVQTAFLKTHYPHEYMTAMLSVHYDDATKLTTFLGECKRLDIDILPPDVNYSQLDFDIEPQTDGKRGIRFGLAAIKNAGIGALTPIIEAREEGGAFTDLADFCGRIDLRQVGKRTLESLAKVGALRAFGTRPQLLAALDRMVAYSTEQHRNRETGQISMFGDGGVTEVEDGLLAHLPNIEEATQREMLNWEKELLGLYVTSHPIDPILNQLEQAQLNFTHELKAAEADRHDKGLRLVGLIASLRVLYTKNNDAMGIIQLEDKYETIEAVLFPRTWEEYKDIIAEGVVVYVVGKLDLSRGDAQIKVEKVTTDVTADLSAPAPMQYQDEDVPAWVLAEDEANYQNAAATSGQNGHANGHSADHDHAGDDTPPPQSFDHPVADAPPVWVRDDDPTEERPVSPPFLQDEQIERRCLVVYFDRCGDDDRDFRRLSRIHGLLMQYHGHDRFEFVIDGEDGAYQLEFPDKTTHICDELVAELEKLDYVRALEAYTLDEK